MLLFSGFYFDDGEYPGLNRKVSKCHVAACSLSRSGMGERIMKKVKLGGLNKESLTDQKMKV